MCGDHNLNLGYIGSTLLFSPLHHTAFIFVLLTQGFYIKIHVATEGCSILIVGPISILGQEFLGELRV